MAAWHAGIPVFAVTRRVIFSLKKNLFSRLKYLSAGSTGMVAISTAVKEELLKAGIAPSRNRRHCVGDESRAGKLRRPDRCAART